MKTKPLTNAPAPDGPVTAKKKKSRDSLWINAEMDNLSAISRFVKNGLSRHEEYRDRPDQRYLVELAVTEVCTNIIRYAYSPLLVRKLGISLKRSGNVMEILILDKGVPFDPTKMPDPNLDEPKEGGYGIYLIRQIMKHVTYHRRGSQWKTLHLTHEIPGQAQTLPWVPDGESDNPGQSGRKTRSG